MRRSLSKFAIQFAIQSVLHAPCSSRADHSDRNSHRFKKGVLHLTWRVPKRYASVEPRKLVSFSLHTDPMSAAVVKAAAVWDQFIAGLEAKLAGGTTDAEQRFAAARDLAEAKGFCFLRADKVAQLPLEQLRDRFAAISGFDEHSEKLDKREAAALLGGVAEPPLTITRCLELYWTLSKDKRLGKAPDQVRRWENPRKKAIGNLI